MRDFYKLLVVGIVMFLAPVVNAESFKVLVIPDNIVTENVALDSYIYDATSEFFADEVVTLLNQTDYIVAPSVSETRALIKKDPSSMLAAKNITARYKTSYNVDYVTLKKLAVKTNSRYVLLLTSFIDSENYILRRTFWDFLNIPGATVVDPAYKISTYAVLVDTSNNKKLWSDTFYKTISVCENRIITRGSSPQSEQLQKIKDYSRVLCPEIAQNVQLKVLPASVYEKESNQIYYDIGNIDNVFTKKYRHLGREYDKVYIQKKADFENFKEDTKVKIDNTKERVKQANEDRKLRAQEKKEAQMQSKLEVKATPVYDNNTGINGISNKNKSGSESMKNAVFKKDTPKVENTKQINYFENNSLTDSIEIKKNKKHNLYGESQQNRPELRDYYQ